MVRQYEQSCDINEYGISKERCKGNLGRHTDSAQQEWLTSKYTVGDNRMLLLCE
jgi:hypothetical protein